MLLGNQKENKSHSCLVLENSVYLNAVKPLILLISPFQNYHLKISLTPYHSKALTRRSLPNLTVHNVKKKK